MSKTFCFVDLYGLGGLATSPGMLTLAGKIKKLGGGFVVLGPYDQSEWQQAAGDLAKRPAADLVGAIGYSLGANNVVQIAGKLDRKIDYVAGIQPLFWALGSAGRRQLRCRRMSARHAASTIRISWPPAASVTRVTQRRKPLPVSFRLTTTSDLHPDVDTDTGVHGLILSDLRNLMPKEN